MRQKLRLIRNKRLLAQNGFLISGSNEATVMEAFHILHNWFHYGIPCAEKIRKMFELCCLEQQREIVIALKNQNSKEEKKLAIELARKLDSFPEIEKNEQPFINTRVASI